MSDFINIKKRTAGYKFDNCRVHYYLVLVTLDLETMIKTFRKVLHDV